MRAAMTGTAPVPMGQDEWRRRTERIYNARQEGRETEALRLQAELVADRRALRAASPDRPVPGADVVLLCDYADHLLDGGHPAEARVHYREAAMLARPRGDRYFIALCGLRGSVAAVEMGDPHGAAAELSRALQRPVLLPPGTRAGHQVEAESLAQAAAESLPEVLEVGGDDDGARDRLRAEATYALGLTLWSLGRLGAAGRVLGRLLDLIGEEDGAAAAVVDAVDIAVLRAEIHLDRGELSALEALRQRWQQRRPDPRWQVLAGAAAHARGHLSEAARILESAAGSATGPVRTTAGWMQINVLFALNRQDEARALLEELAGDDLERAAGVRQLLRSRAESLDEGVGAAPIDVIRRAAIREDEARRPGLAEASVTSSHAAPPGDVTLASAGAAEGRGRCRVADEWARRGLAIERALDQQDIAAAASGLAELEGFSAGLDSPLLAARLAYLSGLVRYYQGDQPEALAQLGRARSAFAAMGMPRHEWSACCVELWALLRFGAPLARLEACEARAQVLMDELLLHVAAEHRISFRANKWDRVERDVARICRDLRSEISAPSSSWLAELRRYRRISTAMKWIVERKRWDRTQADEAEAPSRSGRSIEVERGVEEDTEATLQPQSAFSQIEAQQRWLARASGDPARSADILLPGMLPADSAVLFFVALPDGLEIFVATRWRCHMLRPRTRLRRVGLVAAVEAIQRDIADPANAWSPDMPSLRGAAAALGIEEIAAALPSEVRHLHVLPGEYLYGVPFAALPLQGGPLLRRFSVTMLPWLRLSERALHAPVGVAAGLGVFVSRSAAPPPPGEHYAELPAALHERDLVAPRLGACAQLLVDEQATREAVTTRLPAAALLHVATHGVFRSEQPLSSGLLLSDGWLTIMHIAKLTLCRLRLAVICSCWGANIRSLPGNEPVGLPIALLHRGAGAVLTALWAVGDEFNAERFVPALYDALTRSGPSAAVRDAQAALAEGAPADWAPYVLYADGIAPSWPVRLYIRLRRRRAQALRAY